MAFDWNKASEQSGSEKIGPGIHRVAICKILTASKKGPFKSKKGDPQIMVVMDDEVGAEAAMMLTLSEKAAWTLARLLSRCGADLGRMEAEGIEPKHFAQESLAASFLMGKNLWIKVEPRTADGGKVYMDVTPLSEQEAGQVPAPVVPGSAIGTTPAPDDDLPF